MASCTVPDFQQASLSPLSRSPKTRPSRIVRQRSTGSFRPARMLTCFVIAIMDDFYEFVAGNHPNIVEVLGVYYTTSEHPKMMNIVMECMPMTLRSVLLCLEKRNMRMKESRVKVYMFQVHCACQCDARSDDPVVHTSLRVHCSSCTRKTSFIATLSQRTF